MRQLLETLVGGEGGGGGVAKRLETFGGLANSILHRYNKCLQTFKSVSFLEVDAMSSKLFGV